jgi:hypothetical protein
MSSPRLTALRELAQEAELERRDFVYEATEQVRRFLDANRERLREIGPLILVDDDQDHLVYHPVDETWTTRLTYQDPADGEWYDEEQVVEAVSEIIELYNPADIFTWLMEAARDPAGHLAPADRLADEEQGDGEAGATEDGEDWQRGLPPAQRETIAAQRLWQLADAYRAHIAGQQAQVLREFAVEAEEVLARTGDLALVEGGDDALTLRSDGRFETALDMTELPEGAVLREDAHHPGMTVIDARTVAEFYDPADVLAWVTDALGERYPHVDFTAVYE